MNRPWTAQNIPALHGKLALVTGANRGLGLEITRALARAGATVILGCRDRAKGEAAARQLCSEIPGARLEVMDVDLAELASIRRFAEAFGARFPRLDILCNNASAILAPFGKTRDGFEMHLGTNVIGTYALTLRLLDSLCAAPGARVVNTASLAHRLTPGLDFDDPHFERKPYRDMDAYGKSKLATLLFTFELDRRLKRAAAPVIAVAAHPGYTATNLDLGGFFMRLSTRLFAQPPARGALPALYAATAAGVAGGDYYGPGGFKQLKGFPEKVDCRPEARDPQLAARLWALCERLTGLRYPP
ncbi:MAG TPA: oxidoreductase [Nevskiales bacterium]|nr:oxidoreductase [Nevskiales bacterium]